MQVLENVPTRYHGQGTMPMEEIDDLDRQILDCLQQDARISNLELAERIGLSPTPARAGSSAWKRQASSDAT